MSKYRINPEGVKSVLTKTGHVAEKFESDLKPMQGYVESAAAGCGNSGAVVPALSAFFEYEGTRLTNMGTRVTACLTGAAQATNAYLHGDYEMVGTYQTSAAQARLSEPPKGGW